MQTILGSGGAIGSLLAKELTAYTKNIRLVSRKPQKINESDQLFSADLYNRQQTMQAVAGSEVVYLTAGIQYNKKIWQKQWPSIMQNVIEACTAYKSKLVFFDNVYMYDEQCIPHMTEDCRIDPPSQKGKIRAQLVKMLTDAATQKKLQMLIARSADFYGPSAKTGVLNISVIDNFKTGKKAFWQSDAAKVHSMTFTVDAAKAVALLGNTANAFGSIWHLPTSSERLNGKDFITLTASAMNVKPRFYILKKPMIKMVGFSPAL